MMPQSKNMTARKRKRKRAKPITAWAALDNGRLSAYAVFKTRALALHYSNPFDVVRVEIREIK